MKAKKKPWNSLKIPRLWRRKRDSNPRGLSPKRFSRPPRYDRFDIPAYVFNFILSPKRFDARQARYSVANAPYTTRLVMIVSLFFDVCRNIPAYVFNFVLSLKRFDARQARYSVAIFIQAIKTTNKIYYTAEKEKSQYFL